MFSWYRCNKICDPSGSSPQLGLKIDTSKPIHIRTANHALVKCQGTTSLFTKHSDSNFWRKISFIVVRNVKVLILSNKDLKLLRLLHEAYPHFLGDGENTHTITNNQYDNISDPEIAATTDNKVASRDSEQASVTDNTVASVKCQMSDNQRIAPEISHTYDINMIVTDSVKKVSHNILKTGGKRSQLGNPPLKSTRNSPLKSVKKYRMLKIDSQLSARSTACLPPWQPHHIHTEDSGRKRSAVCLRDSEI